jgi:hypothetical protein
MKDETGDEFGRSGKQNANSQHTGIILDCVLIDGEVMNEGGK